MDEENENSKIDSDYRGGDLKKLIEKRPRFTDSFSFLCIDSSTGSLIIRRICIQFQQR